MPPGTPSYGTSSEPRRFGGACVGPKEEPTSVEAERALRLLPGLGEGRAAERLVVGVLVVPVGDLAGRREPDMVVSLDVLERLVEPLEARRPHDDPRVQ